MFDLIYDEPSIEELQDMEDNAYWERPENQARLREAEIQAQLAEEALDG